MRKCEAVSRPFTSDTSPKRIGREGLEKRRIGTRQGYLHDTGMTLIPERVHLISIYFSTSVHMIPRRNFVPVQVV